MIVKKDALRPTSKKQKTKIAFPGVVPLELDRVEPKEAVNDVKEAMREYAWAANAMIGVWWNYHLQRGTRAMILAKKSAAEIGACAEGELQSAMAKAAGEACRYINRRCLTWLHRFVMGSLTKDSSKYSMKFWRSILCGFEAIPSFTNLPLRLDEYQAEWTRDANDYLWFSAKLLRDPPSDGAKNGTTPIVRFRLRRPRKNTSKLSMRHAAIYRFAEKVATGEKKMPCSQIVHKNGRFFLMLTISRESPVRPTDPAKLAIIRAGRKCAWRIRRSTGSGAYNGANMLRSVGELRASIIERRAERLDLGRQIATATARDRDEMLGRIRGRWNRCCTTYNRQAASAISEALLRHKYGTVVVIDGDDKAALATVGKDPEKNDPTRYPFAQFRKFLKEKLEPHGVVVVERADFRSVKRRISVTKKGVAASRVQ